MDELRDAICEDCEMSLEDVGVYWKDESVLLCGHCACERGLEVCMN